MLDKHTSSLDELTSFALKECPSAFKIIADPNLYRFQSMSVMTKAGTHDVCELLHIAYWGPKTRHEIPVWAGVQDGNVRYYYGKPGMRVKAVYAPFPEGNSNICDQLTPFQFVAPSDHWPRERRANTKAKEAARRRLALLVAFASLLTGRIGQIVDTNHGDLLHEFKEMCEVMQKYKDIKEAEDERNSRPFEWTMQFKTTKRTDKAAPGLESGDTIMTSTLIESVACNSNTVLSVSDDEDVAEHIENTVNTHKRRRYSSSQTDIPRSVLNSSEAAEPSKKMMELLVAVTEQCKTELLGAWTQEQCGQTIEALERQLAEKEKESEEWKAKFLKLEAKVRIFTSSD
ncbi:hypothetical protein E8E13_000784 [Curvularia kusanoi]|uniref:Uncharacterized protein n=1 Tax=Curvularia kusanoi TaxID=90978 RepID=A0A9P4T3U0_CURKU|nr:hypothetical protein E8E13_000784 [Curvularia kusanoi]